MKTKKRTKKSKLLAYSTMAAAALSSTSQADIRIQSTELTLTSGANVTIDFDGLGNLPAKFTLNITTSPYTFTSQVYTQTGTITTSSGTQPQSTYVTVTNTTSSYTINLTPTSLDGKVFKSTSGNFASNLLSNVDVKAKFDAYPSRGVGGQNSYVFSRTFQPGSTSPVSNTNGSFYPGTTGFVGVEFKIEGNVHYGWLELDYSNSSALKIKSFAYEDVPNKKITTNEFYGNDIAAGQEHTIVIDEYVDLVTGSNDHGQLGKQKTMPEFESLGRSDLITVKAGLNHSVALDSGGNVWTWGNNDFGQLGTGDTNQRNEPFNIGITGVREIAVGAHHTLALADEGKVYAWGRNVNGQLGTGDTNDSISPIVAFTNGNIHKLEAGYDHSALIHYDGTLEVWGSNGYGQLGDNSLTNSTVPVTIPGIKVEEVACGGFHTLAVSSGNLYAWGRNDKGQLGSGNYQLYKTPTLVDNSGDWREVRAGALHSLAQNNTDAIFSFGDNSKGQLGLGDLINRNVPTQINSFTEVLGFGAGAFHSAASDGGASSYYGWGQNNPEGKLGFYSSALTEPYPLSFILESSTSGG